MVQFLSIFFFCWISSIFVGFFESSRFFVSPCTSFTGRRYVIDTGPDIGLLAKGCSDGHRVMSMYHQIMHGNSNRTVVESS